APAEAALLRGKRQAEQADPGELAPHGAAPALGRGDDGPPRLEGVVLRHEAADRIGDQLLLFAVVELHGMVLEAEAHLGDDVALDLVRSRVDRGLAEVAVARRDARGERIE